MTVNYEFEVNGSKYKIKMPTAAQQHEARRVYNRAKNAAIADGCMIREQVPKFARERGIITDEREAEIRQLEKELTELSAKLDAGGVELEEAKEWALRMREIRAELLVHNLVYASIMADTAERQADSARDEFLMSVCITDLYNKPVCKNIDDFIARQDDPVVIAGIDKYNELVSGLNSNFVYDLPENKFLTEYNFVDENLQLLEDKVEDVKVERKPFLRNGVPLVITDDTPSVTEAVTES